ncbi:hypothetical protein ACWEIJ_37485 [Lentzea sp. NPDC004789]
MDETGEKEVRLQVGPYSAASLTVSFEPTGMAYELAAGEFFSVVMRGPGSGIVDIGHTADTLVVGAWAEAETLVWTKDGTRLYV